jgi:Holliday junction DNA helicase RuvB
VLLAGPPGLGKTSLAQIVAAELDVPFVQTAGPALERKGDIAAFLSALEPRSVFFVDEIHRLPRALEETFYPAMEDRQPADHDRAGRRRAGDDDRAAAVHADRRDDAVRSADARRCATASGSSTGLSTTTPVIWAGSCGARRGCWESTIEDEGAVAIAARSRGTPRVANRLLKRVRDYAEVRGGGVINAQSPAPRLISLRSTGSGSTGWTARSCGRSAKASAVGRSGSRRLAASVGEEQDTIEDVYEPYLLQRALLERTPRGRVATARAFEHLGLNRPTAQLGLL